MSVSWTIRLINNLWAKKNAFISVALSKWGMLSEEILL